MLKINTVKFIWGVSGCVQKQCLELGLLMCVFWFSPNKLTKHRWLLFGPSSLSQYFSPLSNCHSTQFTKLLEGHRLCAARRYFLCAVAITACTAQFEGWGPPLSNNNVYLSARNFIPWQAGTTHPAASQRKLFGDRIQQALPLSLGVSSAGAGCNF